MRWRCLVSQRLPSSSRLWQGPLSMTRNTLRGERRTVSFRKSSRSALIMEIVGSTSDPIGHGNVFRVEAAVVSCLIKVLRVIGGLLRIEEALQGVAVSNWQHDLFAMLDLSSTHQHFLYSRITFNRSPVLSTG